MSDDYGQTEAVRLNSTLAEQHPDLPHDFLVGPLQARAHIKAADAITSWAQCRLATRPLY